MASVKWLLKVSAIIGASAREQQNSERPGVLGLDQDTRYTFEGYKLAYGRTYAHGSDEHNMRKEIFNKRLAKILAQNSRSNSWVADVNQFSDRTDAELQRVRGFRRKTLDKSPGAVMRGISSFLQLASTGNMSRNRVQSSGQQSGNDNEFVETAERTCSSKGESCIGLGDVACCNDLTCGHVGICVDSEPHPLSLDYSSTIHGGLESMDQGTCGSCWAVAAADIIGLYAARANPNFKKKTLPTRHAWVLTESPSLWR